MRRLLFKSLLGASYLTLMAVGAAHAGGFSRGNADTDIIFEDGNFNMRTSVTYVAPTRKFTKNPDPLLVGTSYTESYAIPSFAAKVNLTNNLRCAATLVENNGGSAQYDFPTSSGKILEEFTTYESAATCGLSFDLDKGKFWLLGGGYSERFDYHRVNDYSSLGLGQADLNLDGTKYGYRIGAAYEIPEIALRGEVMYRSGTNYGSSGTLVAPAGVLLAATAGTPLAALFAPIVADPTRGPAFQVPVPAIGVGSLPQSVDFKLQSGIAPGWLAFGEVKWTDWSALTTLDVRSQATNTQITSDEYYWKDGWTVTGGIGHQFTDSVSGLMSLTWDRGVSTGWDLASDTYTLAVGASAKDKMGGELHGGVGLTYISSAAETKYGADPNVTDAGDQAVKAGYAVAFSAGYSIKW